MRCWATFRFLASGGDVAIIRREPTIDKGLPPSRKPQSGLQGARRIEWRGARCLNRDYRPVERAPCWDRRGVVSGRAGSVDWFNF